MSGAVSGAVRGRGATGEAREAATEGDAKGGMDMAASGLAIRVGGAMEVASGAASGAVSGAVS